MEHTAVALWQECQRVLQDDISDVARQTWFKPVRPLGFDGRELRLGVPNDFHRRWLEDRYAEDVARAIGVVQPGATVAYITAEQAEAAPVLIPAERPPAAGTNLVARYTFDNFVVGESNKFAHAAALAVAERPGDRYNPLFIYGASGLGKTHLLHAVGHHSLHLNPGAHVKYVSTETFTSEFVDSVRHGTVDLFKKRYRTVDLLLIDDIQFLERKEQTLEEFFYTFNFLQEAQRQVVISSDRPPNALVAVEARLRSRFAQGLLTDVQPPTVETRLAILRRNAEFAPRPVPEPVLELIAENISDNIRELEGALTRVTAWAALNGEPITLDMARRVLGDVLPNHPCAPLTPAHILDVAAHLYGFSVEELCSKSRKAPLVNARHAVMYSVRELTGLSLPKIGELFGGRDHTTALYAIKKVEDQMKEHRTVYDQVTRLLAHVRQPQPAA